MGESTTRLMLRVRDTIDRHHAEPLDLGRLAGLVHLSPSHVVRARTRPVGSHLREQGDVGEDPGTRRP